MFDSGNKHLTFVIYDGIENSVFESQILHPLLAMIEQNLNLEVTLVSFEKKRPSNELLQKLIPAHERLHLVLSRRLPFFGKISLRLAIFQFKRLLKIIPSHQIIARGPLAGQVVLTAINRLAEKNPEKLRVDSPEKFPTITIQARGLCAEEYRYSLKFKKTNWLKRLYQQFIYKKLQAIEFEVYRNKRKTDVPNNVTIEAVSPALKEYLINYFRADQSKIIIATKDLPKSFLSDQIALWRKEIRKQLAIPADAIVYCYSGSFKPWQCATETISSFAFEYSRNPHCFLLILTTDQTPFVQEITRHKIPTTHYLVKTVRAHELYSYLAAGDYGMLLREKDVINWVSRPTKMLEYQAVGLKIVHNNTVAWLANK